VVCDTHYPNSIRSSDEMNDELERIWKDTLPKHLLGELRKT
jgi:hypothetical protein